MVSHGFFFNRFGQKLTEIYPILINMSIYNICNFFFDHFGFLLYITISKNDLNWINLDQISWDLDLLMN